jgi:outer membrane protein assembly factor BamB
MEVEKTNLNILSLEYGFEIVPDCPAATAAGYTAKDRQQLQVLTGPIYNKDNFYYTAGSGSIFVNVYLSSILVARRKTDGALVYAVNCQDYTLDTGATYLGPSKTVCQTRPVIVGNKLYLTSDSVTNIGPQLFCINKTNGVLIYAIAYYLPDAVVADYGVNFLTVRADYSLYQGSNSRVSTLNPVVISTKSIGDCQQNTIYVGTSSIQNVYNVGLIPGTSYYTGYPFFTDQGFLFCIKEIAGYPALVHQTPTCAPPIKVGDIVSKTGPPELNPFQPGKNSVVIDTITTNIIIRPAKVNGLYLFAQKVNIAIGTIINPALFAPFWNTLGAVIHLDESTETYTLAQILPLLTVGQHTITTALLSVVNISGTAASGQLPLWYTKRILDNETIDNTNDANALGYWANDVWGAAPLLSLAGNVIYFGTGQTHAAPLGERIYFADPDRNYRILKVPLVDATNAYATAPTPNKLNTLNALKKSFLLNIRRLCLEPIRSPRGQMSYPDSIMAASPSSGRLLFAVRSVQCDVYNYLGTQDILLLFYPSINDLDGDVSSGIFEYKTPCTCGNPGKVLVTCSNKNGGSPILDVTNMTREIYNNGYISKVGIEVGEYVYTGPNSLLGGSNYQSTQHKNLVIGLTLNNAAAGGSLGSDMANGKWQSHIEAISKPFDDNFEKLITPDGVYIPTTLSAAYALNIVAGKIQWYRELNSYAAGASTVIDNTYYTNDDSGTLYGLNIKNGVVKWQYDAAAGQTPMIGGIASPSYDPTTQQLFWIASYDIPEAINTAGQFGNVFRPKRCIKWTGNNCYLNGKIYNSPANKQLNTRPQVLHKWTSSTTDSIWTINVRHFTNNTTVYVGEFNAIITDKIVSFKLLKQSGDSMIIYNRAKFVNKAAYNLEYSIDGVTAMAYLTY